MDGVVFLRELVEALALADVLISKNDSESFLKA